jgi:hypothetical protein
MTPFEQYIALCREAEENGAPYCQICAGVLAHPHDHREDETGLDDGPWMLGRSPRKKAALKTAEEMKVIRAKAWATRRASIGAKL